MFPPHKEAECIMLALNQNNPVGQPRLHDVVVHDVALLDDHGHPLSVLKRLDGRAPPDEEGVRDCDVRI